MDDPTDVEFNLEAQPQPGGITDRDIFNFNKSKDRFSRACETKEHRLKLSVDKYNRKENTRRLNHTIKQRLFEMALAERGQSRSYSVNLLNMISYFNNVQDTTVTEVSNNAGTKTIVYKGRPLNPHEEDIYNAALVTLKRMIQNDPINKKKYIINKRKPRATK